MSEQQGEYKTKAARKSGVYWVKWLGSNGFQIAEFNKDENNWSLIGDETEYQDSDFNEINESRIKTPDEL